LKPGVRSFPKVGTCEEDLGLVVRELGRFASELEFALREKIGEEKAVSLEVLGIGNFHSWQCRPFTFFDELLQSPFELTALVLEENKSSLEITYVSHRELSDLVFIE
jgi:hypothetical protein